jgi:hypothetical protein
MQTKFNPGPPTFARRTGDRQPFRCRQLMRALWLPALPGYDDPASIANSLSNSDNMIDLVQRA